MKETENVDKPEQPKEVSPLGKLFEERAKWANAAEDAKVELLTGDVNYLHVHQRKLNALRELEAAVIDQIIQWRQRMPLQ
jgi:hypothetical protein